MASRRSKRQEPENHERWLISYADFITLLFAFFVVMYALSSLNEGKYKVFSASLVSIFGSSEANRANNQQAGEQQLLLKSLVERRDARQGERMRKQQEAMRGVAKNLQQILSAQVSSGQMQVSHTRRGVVLDIRASTLFDTGDATLRKESISTLAEVAGILAAGDQSIEIEGYTDDIPINSEKYPSNWELSSARASSVARLFIDYSVPAERLTVVGSAANRPVASNASAEGRALNRRVTVTLLSPEFDRHQPESLDAVQVEPAVRASE